MEGKFRPTESAEAEAQQAQDLTCFKKPLCGQKLNLGVRGEAQDKLWHPGVKSEGKRRWIWVPVVLQSEWRAVHGEGTGEMQTVNGRKMRSHPQGSDHPTETLLSPTRTETVT